MSHSPPKVTHTTQIHPRAGGRAHKAAVAAAVASSASESRGGTAASQLIGEEAYWQRSLVSGNGGDHVAAGHLPTLLGSPSRSHSGLRLAPPWGDGSLRGT